MNKRNSSQETEGETSSAKAYSRKVYSHYDICRLPHTVFRPGNSAASSNKHPDQILEMRTTNCKSASCKRKCHCSRYSCPSESCTADLGWYIAHWHTANVECHYRSWCRLALSYQG